MRQVSWCMFMNFYVKVTCATYHAEEIASAWLVLGPRVFFMNCSIVLLILLAIDQANHHAYAERDRATSKKGADADQRYERQPPQGRSTPCIAGQPRK